MREACLLAPEETRQGVLRRVAAGLTPTAHRKAANDDGLLALLAAGGGSQEALNALFFNWPTVDDIQRFDAALRLDIENHNWIVEALLRRDVVDTMVALKAYADAPAAQQKPTCAACLVNAPVVALFPCGHVPYCKRCFLVSHSADGRASRCPLCRAETASALPVRLP